MASIAPLVLSAEGQGLILEVCLAGSGLVLKSSSYNQLCCFGHNKNHKRASSALGYMKLAG